MTKCPLCFTHLAPSPVVWMANGGEARADEVATSYYGSPREQYEQYPYDPPDPSSTPPPRDWFVSTLGPATEICPTCHYRLPDGWRDGKATCVAMAGARDTGKSVYIGVLVKMLQLLGDRLGFVVEPATKSTGENYREHYQKKLFDERAMVDPTAALETGLAHQRDPLIFRLGRWDAVPQYLVIRDVAGEDLQNPVIVGQTWTKFFANADGVLFMFDPLKVQSIAAHLRDLIKPQENDVAADPGTVLARVLSLIGTRQTRLAVVLSKFDALHELREVERSEWSRIMSNPGAGFSRDSSLAPAPYNEIDGQLVNAEVRSLLTRLGAQSIVTAADVPHTGAALETRFFAVSALGALTKDDQVNEVGIAPFRCLDPVRWVLSRNGVGLVREPKSAGRLV
ncbi:TRAFAC clade GTPase domain-containing protein [Rhodococcus koreensis]